MNGQARLGARQVTVLLLTYRNIVICHRNHRNLRPLVMQRGLSLHHYLQCRPLPLPYLRVCTRLLCPTYRGLRLRYRRNVYRPLLQSLIHHPIPVWQCRQHISHNRCLVCRCPVVRAFYWRVSVVAFIAFWTLFRDS